MNEIRVSVFIVTYRNPVDLNSNIASLVASGAPARIYVINNHSQFSLAAEHEKAVTVLHNRLRPDFSTGHLSRNWNQALLHGFQDLNHPASDIVVTVQDDVIFKPDWFHRLIDLHRRYSFITMGVGDSFCSYLPEAVKKIGMWDERFCNLGFHEGDYFLRSIIYNREYSSVNDLCTGRQNNPAEGNSMQYSKQGMDRADSMLISVPHWNPDRKDAHVSSVRYHPLSETLFQHKWGVRAEYWGAEHFAIRKPLTYNYVMYPYFEKDVEGLREKNYIVADEKHRERWADFVAEVSKPPED